MCLKSSFICTLFAALNLMLMQNIKIQPGAGLNIQRQERHCPTPSHRMKNDTARPPSLSSPPSRSNHPTSSQGAPATEFQRQSAQTSALLIHFQTSSQLIDQTLQRTEKLLEAAENPTGAWIDVAQMVPRGEDKEMEVNGMLQEAGEIAKMYKEGEEKADVVQRIDQLLEKIEHAERGMSSSA